jgi:hypothetical protein
MQRQKNETNKVRFVIACVLLSFIPFGLFVRDAEGNFRSAEVKTILSRRRKRLDAEHNVDREGHAEAFAKLDDMFRVTEKQEIEKYLEIGKTPSDYYRDKEERKIVKM